MSASSSGWSRDAGRVVGLLTAAGVAAGVAWGVVVEPPLVTRDAGGLLFEGAELARRIDSDVWFALLAVALATPCGVVVGLWRRIDPVVGVVALMVGAVVASGVCRLVGGLVGPGSPVSALREAELGTSAPEALTTHTWVVYAVWPLAAAVGVLIALLLRPNGPPRTAQEGGSSTEQTDKTLS